MFTTLGARGLVRETQDAWRTNEPGSRRLDPSYVPTSLWRNGIVKKDLLTSLDTFDHSTEFEQYNMFNCDKAGALTDAEIGLAKSLEPTDLSGQDLSAIRDRVDSDLGARLVAFSLRMATAAIQQGRRDFVTAGAAALTLDRDEIDERDVYVALAVLHDAGTRLDLDVEDIFKIAAANATSRRRVVVVDGFIGGGDYMKSLKSMGVRMRGDNSYVVSLI